MEVVTDCFKTLFIGVAMQGLAFGPIRDVHRPQQQEQPKQEGELRDGQREVVEGPHMTQERPSIASGGVGAVALIVPFDPIGEYLHTS